MNIIESGNLNRKMEFNRNEICRLESRQRAWDVEEQIKHNMKERKEFEERLDNFINERSEINKFARDNCDDAGKPQKKPITTSNDNYKKICRFLKRKREMETSTPVTKRREVALIGDEDESPIATMKSDSQSSERSSSLEDDGVKQLNPTGVSDDMIKTHLTPPAIESSSMEDRRLYTTAKNLTTAAELVGVIRRSQSLPDVFNDHDQNQYWIRMSTPKRILRRTLSAYNIDLSPWDLNHQDMSSNNVDTREDIIPKSSEFELQAQKGEFECNDPRGAACDLQIVNEGDRRSSVND